MNKVQGQEKKSRSATAIDAEQQDLPPIGSLSEECTPLKIKYDNCFNKWFAENFLKGDNDLSICDKYFKEYNDCLKAAMIRMNIDVKELSKELIDSKNDKLKDGSGIRKK